MSIQASVSYDNNIKKSSNTTVDGMFSFAKIAQNSDIETLDISLEVETKEESDISPSFMDKLEDIGGVVANALGGLGTIIEKTGAKVAGSISAVVEDKSWWDCICDTVQNVANFVEDTCATVSTLGVSVVEGVVQFGEAVVDLVAILGTGVLSIGTGFVDGVQFINGLITGDEWESVTKKMWNGTKAFVSVQATTSLFDMFYEKTSVGNWMKENTWNFELIRGVGSGIGYIGGVTLATIATCGLAGPLLGTGTAATTAGTGAAVTSGQLALTAGLAGTARGTEKAWSEGADIVEGLTYGGVSGAWEGVQFYTGAKIGGLNISNLGTVGNVATRVGLDALDSGSEGFVQPLTSLIYKYDASKSFEENYAAAFNESGGMMNVATQAAIGGGASLLGEALQARRYFKDNESVDIEVKPVDVEADLNRYNEIMNIMQTDEYRQWKYNTEHGYATILRQDFEDMELELKDLEYRMSQIANPDITKAVNQSVNDTRPQLEDIRKAFEAQEYKDYKQGILNDPAKVNYYSQLEDIYSQLYLDKQIEIAELFQDPRQYMYAELNKYNKMYPGDAQLNQYLESLRKTDVSKINDINLYKVASQHLSPDTMKKVDAMWMNPSSMKNILTSTEQDVIDMFTKHGGPAVDAYLRETDVLFNGRTFKGADVNAMDEYIKRCCIERKMGVMGIDDVVDSLDTIIDMAGPIKQDMKAVRYVSNLFFENKLVDIQDIKPGTMFNDKAYTSALAIDKLTSWAKHPIKLELDIPKGSKAAYIESFTGVSNYNQQEILIGRNSNFRITDYPQLNPETGQITIKARLEPQVSNVIDDLQLKNIVSNSQDTKYFNKLFSNYDGVDIQEFTQKLKSKGLLERFDTEVQDIRNKGLYQFDIPEHNVDHVERVMLFSMYMGDELDLNSREMDLLIEASKGHDCGRINLQTDTEHGKISAENIVNIFSKEGKYSKEEINMIAAAIEYHEMTDSPQALQSVFDKYNIPLEQQESVSKIANILKDADALDRSRFPGNLNPNYFRNKGQANKLLKTSCQMQEIRGKKELNRKIRQNAFSKADLQYINAYRKRGVPDYVIDFGYKYNRKNIIPYYMDY